MCFLKEEFRKIAIINALTPTVFPQMMQKWLIIFNTTGEVGSIFLKKKNLHLYIYWHASVFFLLETKKKLDTVYYN